MRVGICFPMVTATVLQRDTFVNWCEAVDGSGLSTIALGERIAYPAQDPLVALAVAGAVTKKIRLMTSVVVLPLRNIGMVAKEVASLDILTEGRFTFGVGIGNRLPDYQALDMPWTDRAQRIESQIEKLRAIWRRDTHKGEGAISIGPAPLTPEGPPIVYGAMSDVALRRAGRLADGVITWSNRPNPEAQKATVNKIHQVWEEAGRSGRPYIIATMYFALGPKSEEILKSHLSSYYNYSSEAQNRVSEINTYTEHAVEDAIQTYAEVGVDELLFGPPTASIDQINYLANIVSRLGYSV